MTDDQDEASVEHMLELQDLLVERGTTFTNAFVSTPLCCPSRATFLRGQYEHNHRVVANGAPRGGYERWQEQGLGRSTLATWLDDAGYETALFGKYLNEYGKRKDTKLVPPGWDQWYSRLHGDADDGTSYRINENGKVAKYAYADLHDADYLSDRAEEFIRSREGKSEPFFAYIATKARRAPGGSAPRHDGEFADEPLPRPPSFDEEDTSDKPRNFQRIAPFTEGQVRRIEDDYRQRLRSLQAVDDLIANVVSAVRETGEVDNTYFVFTSDNGWFNGEHRRPGGKELAYEEASSVPLIVRGPGVPVAQVPHLVSNNDFAPTVADWAGAEVPDFVDGKSYASILSDDPPEPEEWRRQILIEHILLYQAVRTQDEVYVEYVNNERELYDMEEDPYQLQSRHDSDPEAASRMARKLESLRGCVAHECREAEEAR